MSDNPTDKRVYTGIYRDRFKKEIQVLLVTKDIDTGEEIVAASAAIINRTRAISL